MAFQWLYMALVSLLGSCTFELTKTTSFFDPNISLEL
jgi:hypothetical protein